ncbi:methylmalonate-semialdehyde dehydrogenase (acylating) [Vibrio nigripulchritudo]|uniref:CoA-acylating methylmalonate-semialdehyde dehydrogenase n=1 Tax=Vibrio nigripulchritudo TaxID=28173 RepID=UPI00190DE1AE|nr:CoA-acylating methylmalonate-semialdehyde dehydrogenase [Vibrio nigripulchritudo]BCL73566.1 methylmalonate-semialdehyde dehydrogenase (acylating) [Vibrio nigripulchritudo]BDU34934.1 methylmalonate-semialdehyde dehydrogenase (acylating) [Vibrio nigripulchritudo]
MERVGHFINNTITGTQDSDFADVYNPATGEKILNVALASAKTTEQAVEAAEAAFPGWSKTPSVVRARVLFKFKALVEKYRDELAEIITEQHGKVLSDAQGEITRGLEVVEFACGIPHAQKGEHSLNVGRQVDSHSMMQPLGVCAGITPFNFPVMVPMWMFPIAIACGNTFVLKPSEKNPTPSMFLAELLKQAGLPDGVFNVVNGDKTAVDVLLTHSAVQAVSFVGSTPIAEYIYSTASAHGKRCQALGGAKNHMVVMPDADTSQVANALMGAAYGSAGERCMAISVAVCVGEEAAKNTVESLLLAISKLKVGAGNEKDEPDMGPLISAAHRDKVLGYINQGIEEGAKLLVDGRNYQVPGAENGFFVGPTLFDKVTKEMTIYQEEIFGPVLSVVHVETLEEAIQLINDHEYGNGTSIFTESGRAARLFQENVLVGMIGVNVPIPVPMAFHCFGGWKRSIFGPLNMHGPDGVRFFTRMKTVTTRWPESEGMRAEFSMPTMK